MWLQSSSPINPNNLLVVVSAMGKTTDMLERVLTLSATGEEFGQTLTSLKKYHYEIIDHLIRRSINA